MEKIPILINNGMSIPYITIITGISEKRIRRYCRNNNIELPYNPFKSKLSNNDLEEIYSLLRNRNLSYSQIGNKFGVSRQRIHQIAISLKKEN